MGLPTTRNTNYSAGSSPVKAADLNAIQDCIIGRKFPNTFPRQIIPTFMIASGTWNWTVTPTVYVMSGGVGTLMISFPLIKGERLTDVIVSGYGDGAVDATYTLKKVGSGQAVTTLCTGTDTNRAAAWGTFSLSTLGAFTIATLGDLEAVVLQIDANAANYRVGNMKIVTDIL